MDITPSELSTHEHEQLLLYWSGELPGGQRQTVEQWLQENAAAQTYLADLQTLDALAREMTSGENLSAYPDKTAGSLSFLQDRPTLHLFEPSASATSHPSATLTPPARIQQRVAIPWLAVGLAAAAGLLFGMLLTKNLPESSSPSAPVAASSIGSSARPGSSLKSPSDQAPRASEVLMLRRGMTARSSEIRTRRQHLASTSYSNVLPYTPLNRP